MAGEKAKVNGPGNLSESTRLFSTPIKDEREMWLSGDQLDKHCVHYDYE